MSDRKGEAGKGREGGIGRGKTVEKGAGGLDLDICPRAPELLVTPLATFGVNKPLYGTRGCGILFPGAAAAGGGETALSGRVGFSFYGSQRTERSPARCS